MSGHRHHTGHRSSRHLAPQWNRAARPTTRAPLPRPERVGHGSHGNNNLGWDGQPVTPDPFGASYEQSQQRSQTAVAPRHRRGWRTTARYVLAWLVLFAISAVVAAVIARSPDEAGALSITPADSPAARQAAAPPPAADYPATAPISTELIVTTEPVTDRVRTTLVSTPPGADIIVLEGNRTIGAGRAPLLLELDPTQPLTAVFSLDGYAPTAIELPETGELERTVTATLSPLGAVAQPSAAVAAPPTQPQAATASGPFFRVPERRARQEATPAPPAQRTPKRAKATKRRARNARRSSDDDDEDDDEPSFGYLMLGTKPPCKIYIDGHDTGLKTPQRNIKVYAGRHQITLVNKEYGIRASKTVRIHAGKATRIIRDFRD